MVFAPAMCPSATSSPSRTSRIATPEPGSSSLGPISRISFLRRARMSAVVSAMAPSCDRRHDRDDVAGLDGGVRAAERTHFLVVHEAVHEWSQLTLLVEQLSAQ